MDMTRLRYLRLAKPFRPFYLLVNDGSRIFVDKPHHCALSPDLSRAGVVANLEIRFFRPEQLRDVDVMPVPLKKR